MSILLHAKMRNTIICCAFHSFVFIIICVMHYTYVHFHAVVQQDPIIAFELTMLTVNETVGNASVCVELLTDIPLISVTATLQIGNGTATGITTHTEL